MAMNKEHLRTGDKATCRFRFIKNPEYLKAGTRMVFREGRTKAVGNVTNIIPHVSGAPSYSGKQKAMATYGSQGAAAAATGHGRSKGRRGRGGRHRDKGSSTTTGVSAVVKQSN